jgi:hypothetical protein
MYNQPLVRAQRSEKVKSARLRAGGAGLLAAFALGLGLLVGTAGAAPAGEVKAMLKVADGFRLASGEVEVQTQIRLLKNGELDKERLYKVLLKPQRRSLVISESSVEKGQKVLMLADDFWIILPSSQRPVRITPAQKLLGEASAGDIANMTWSEDYDGQLGAEVERAGKACRQLDLLAQHKGATYRRIVLYVARATGEPVAAELYVASDKLAKEASFEMGELHGRHQVVMMRLIDHIQTNRVTEVRYLDQTARPVPEEVFNPMYLTHNELQ